MWLATLALTAPAQTLDDGACACFRGQTRGNDVVDARVRLCRRGSALDGGFDWTGRASGRSFRVLEGSVDGSAITLRDAAVPVSTPSDGWRFCAIDAYTLTLGADGSLTGNYVSAACRDRATVTLERADCAAGEVAVKGPRRELVPDEVQACRDRGALWLSDPDYYERTEIRAGAAWVPVWQVLDRHEGRSGYLLVYPESCRVVVGVVEPGAPLSLVPPPGSVVTSEEEAMLRRWSSRW
ncbi:MAG: hypothetical protein H6735_03390 [Alphaproteobacteria bacterium]|nr:hypothetical protein [Alphaproteobacteria bacterium]